MINFSNIVIIQYIQGVFVTQSYKKDKTRQFSSSTINHFSSILCVSSNINTTAVRKGGLKQYKQSRPLNNSRELAILTQKVFKAKEIFSDKSYCTSFSARYPLANITPLRLIEIPQ